MDYEAYDNDTNPNDEDYFDFVAWLKDRTARQFRETKDNPQAQRLILLRYWKQGYGANLGPSELIDFLGVDTPSILDMAGYTDEEGDVVMQISDTLTEQEIRESVYHIGDEVILKQVPPYLYDIPIFKETVELMERCLGNVFRVMDIDNDRQLELWVTVKGKNRVSAHGNHHTLYLEPECFVPFLEPPGTEA